MKKINAFEKAIANQVHSLRECGFNPTVFWAYRKSQDANNDLIDFSEIIWDTDIKPIVDTLNSNDITEFTISCQFSGLITTMVLFEKYGFKVAGTTEVTASYRDWSTGKNARIPAVIMKKEVQ